MYSVHRWATQLVCQIDGSRSRLLLSWTDHSTRTHHSEPFPITPEGCQTLANHLTRFINGSNVVCRVRILWFDPLRRRWVLLHSLDHFYPHEQCVKLWRAVGVELGRRLKRIGRFHGQRSRRDPK